MTDVAEISGDLRAGVSPPYGAVDVVASDSLAQATYLTYLPPPTAIDGFITFNDDVQIFDVAVDEPTNVTLDDVVLDVTGSMDTDLSEAFAGKQWVCCTECLRHKLGVYLQRSRSQRIAVADTFGGRNLSSFKHELGASNACSTGAFLSQNGSAQAFAIQQAMAVQQAQANAVNAAYQQAQAQYQQQAQENELVLGEAQQNRGELDGVDQIISKGYKYAVYNGQSQYW